MTPASTTKNQFQPIVRDLRAGGVCVTTEFPMSQATTFRLGGPAPLFVDCTTATQLAFACGQLRAAKLPFLLIGGGSNLLVADTGPGAVIVRYQQANATPALADEQVEVSAAASFDSLAEFCCRNGRDNLVHASGIPGTVGGAIVGNAGAFGWQIGDDLAALQLLEPDGTQRWLAASEITFSYRHSSLKYGDRIVLAARLSLPSADPEALLAERRRILALRAEKHPDLTQDSCAGSFFRNVEPTSKAGRRQAAGWFLEQAGAKSMRVGGAAVFHKHANIPVKGNAHCKAADVARLTEQMAAAVRQKFDLTLQPEVQRIGTFDHS